MQTLAQIKALLEAHGLSPRHALGQNFLIDHSRIRKLLDAAAPAPGDLVLEVGPGTGTMTEELLALGCNVIAAELDRGMCGILRERFAPHAPHFTLIEGDCLAGKRSLSGAILEALAGRPFSLVSNLPYSAGTPVMLTLLADHPECSGLFVTVQREVAERIMAGPGSRDFGPLAVVASAVSRRELICRLPPGCFWPPPKVESAMVAMRRLAAPLCDRPRDLAEFAQRLFTQRRKQIGAVLGRDRAWPDGVEPGMRAEDLPVDRIIALMRACEAG